MKAQKNIDIELYSMEDMSDVLSFAYHEGKNEILKFYAPSDGYYAFALFYYDLSSVTNVNYKMSVDINLNFTCNDDVYEENDSFQSAYLIPEMYYNTPLENMQYCPGDIDVYKIKTKCGEKFDINLFQESVKGDLDLYVVDKSKENVVQKSETYNDTESVKLVSVYDGHYYIVVIGYPVYGTVNSYSLAINKKSENSCTDDEYEPNNSPESATPINEDTEFSNLKLCCNTDWFYFYLKKGDAFIAELKNSGSSDISMNLYDENLNLIKTTKSTIDYTSETEGKNKFFLEIMTDANEIDLSYGFEIVFIPGNSAGCTINSCPIWKVCDESSGECVSDFCEVKEDCPQPYDCIDTFCTKKCNSDSDCREDYFCKKFEDNNYCGIGGEAEIGEGCFYMSDCSENMICLFKENGGYCTMLNCASDDDCPKDSACIEFEGKKMCARLCDSDNDCRTQDGFFCSTISSKSVCIK